MSCCEVRDRGGAERRGACSRSGAAGQAARGNDRAKSQGDPEKREEKEEIAHWFAIWLETPDTFFDWLEVRKESPGFKKFPMREDDE